MTKGKAVREFSELGTLIERYEGFAGHVKKKGKNGSMLIDLRHALRQGVEFAQAAGGCEEIGREVFEGGGGDERLNYIKSGLRMEVAGGSDLVMRTGCDHCLSDSIDVFGVKEGHREKKQVEDAERVSATVLHLRTEAVVDHP